MVTSGFLHENVFHIGFNMYLLYVLGSMLEPALGRLRFGLIYAVSLLSRAAHSVARVNGSVTLAKVYNGGFPQMIKKLIVLLAGMLVTVAVYAAGAQLRGTIPPTLTPCAMATRCGTSGPNHQFREKALAMAGDLAGQSAGAQPASDLSRRCAGTCRSSTGPRLTLQPRVRAERDAVSAIPLSELRMFLKDMRVMDSNVVSSAPYVVGLEEARLRGAVGQNLYVRSLRARPASVGSWCGRRMCSARLLRMCPGRRNQRPRPSRWTAMQRW